MGGTKVDEFILETLRYCSKQERVTDEPFLREAETEVAFGATLPRMISELSYLLGVCRGTPHGNNLVSVGQGHPTQWGGTGNKQKK